MTQKRCHLRECDALFHQLEWLSMNGLKASFTPALLPDVRVNSEIQFRWKGGGRAVFAPCSCSTQHVLGVLAPNQPQHGGHDIGVISAEREQPGA